MLQIAFFMIASLQTRDCARDRFTPVGLAQCLGPGPTADPVQGPDQKTGITYTRRSVHVRVMY